VSERATRLDVRASLVEDQSLKTHIAHTMQLLLSIILASAASSHAFFLNSASTRKSQLQMASSMASQVKAAMPTADDWLSVCEPGLRKTTLAMFRSCKEIAYKIRTASCDKMACFNEFG
jgi:hypothetical protein